MIAFETIGNGNYEAYQVGSGVLKHIEGVMRFWVYLLSDRPDHYVFFPMRSMWENNSKPDDLFNVKATEVVRIRDDEDRCVIVHPDFERMCQLVEEATGGTFVWKRP